MNQRQIESFLAVAETGNFTRAAERLYISQPAVSKQVLSLEEELGFSLLIREYHKNVQLTEAGKLYYDFFHKVTEEYKKVYGQAQQYRQKTRGTLRIGILTGWKIQEKLQTLLEQMKQSYPEIEIRMSFADLEPLRKEAEAGKLDLIFTIRDSVKDADHEAVKLAEMNRVLFYAEELFEKIQKQSADNTKNCVKKIDGDVYAESENEDSRISGKLIFLLWQMGSMIRQNLCGNICVRMDLSRRCSLCQISKKRWRVLTVAWVQ